MATALTVTAAGSLSAQQTEEAAMARWVDESLPTLTEKFLRLKREGENPSR